MKTADRRTMCRWKHCALLAGLALLAAFGGCQTGGPRFGGESILSPLGFSAVPGQWEPGIDESDGE